MSIVIEFDSVNLIWANANDLYYILKRVIQIIKIYLAF